MDKIYEEPWKLLIVGNIKDDSLKKLDQPPCIEDCGLEYEEAKFFSDEEED